MLTRNLIIIVAVVAALSSAASVSVVQLANPGGTAIAQDPAANHDEILKRVLKHDDAQVAYFTHNQAGLKEVKVLQRQAQASLKQIQALNSEMRSSLEKTQNASEKSLRQISGVGRQVQGVNDRLIQLENNHRREHR